jgi:hypothetical protein
MISLSSLSIHLFSHTNQRPQYFLNEKVEKEKKDEKDGRLKSIAIGDQTNEPN